MRSAPTPPTRAIPLVGARPARESRAGPAPTGCREARYSSPVGADLVRDSRMSRRGSRMRSAPTQPHPRHSPVGARPARKSRAGPATGCREARYSSPVGADLVRDSRMSRRGSRMRSAPTQPHPRHSPVGARPARKSRAGPATGCREARYSSPVGADLVRDSRMSRRGSRMRSAPTQPHPRHSPCRSAPCARIAGRARFYRLPGGTVFLPRRSGPCPR